jgi:hypothetical protein
MTKVKYHKRRTATVANSSRGRWLLATFVMVACCTLWAVTYGAELVDSGWAIGIPSPFSNGESNDDAHQQLLLQRVLDQTNVPLLNSVPSTPNPVGAKSPSAGPAKQTLVEARQETRVAARPDILDGWRAALETAPPIPTSPAATPAPTTSAAPSTEVATAPATGRDLGPQFGPPSIPATTAKNTTTNDDLECDCSGQPQHVKTDKSAARGGLSSLADAYNLLPSDSSANAAPRTQHPAQGPEHEALDAAALEALGNSLEADCGQGLAEAAAPKAVQATSPPIKPVMEDTQSPAANNAPSEAAVVDRKPNLYASSKTLPSSKRAVEKAETSPAVPAVTPTPAPPVAEAVTSQPLTKQLIALRTRVRAVLKGYYRKQLNSADNDPWEVMHGMLAYELQSRIRQGGPSGNPITSVGWLCYNKPCKGQTLLYVNPEGEVRAKYGVGLQGHLGQLLAMLAQCHVSQDYPIHVGKSEFTVRDLIEAEKKTCYPKSELTFKLIALQHYIDLNEKWVNDQGVEWDFSRLISEELAQPIRGAACGGTHRLSGLSLAVKKRVERGEPLDGEYAQAAEFVKKYQQYAFRLQNRDGSLSTQWFRGAGDEDDLDRRIKTTGHILEWLCYSLSDEELRDAPAVRAVTYLSNIMYSNYDHEWEIGPRSHATHALMLYDERVFQPFDGKDTPVAVYQTPPQVAKSGQPSGVNR